MTDQTEAMDNLIAQDADLIEICPDDLVQQLFAEADNFKVDREVGVRGMLYRAADRIEAQAAEIERLCNELDITNADHIALWLERNMEPSAISYLAVQIVEAHEAALRQPTQSDVLREALEGVLPYVLNDYFQCNGDKCRHPTCVSCFGEDFAEGQFDKANLALTKAKAALDARGLEIREKGG